MSVDVTDRPDHDRDRRSDATEYSGSRRQPNRASRDLAGAGHSRRDRHLRGGRARHPSPAAPLAEPIGKTRYIVLVAVVSVILVSVTLFVMGAGLAVKGIWHAASSLTRGEGATTTITVDLLEVVSVMLKAVVFYLIGVGFYSLFIAPLNLTAALGIRSFNDLEIKVVSVVIVIMAVTFLEHFIRWDQAVETLLYGLSLGVVVGALVFFQMHTHRAAREDEHDDALTRSEAQRELFHEDHEEREVRPEQELAELRDNPPPGRSGQEARSQ
jgi:uncharacterized membrane protein YqhA